MQATAPLWLTRPEDIHAHLLYASAEIGNAVLTVEGMQVHGTLLAPEEASGRIPFSPDARLDGLVRPPAPGRSVRVDYVGRDDAYSFFSEMAGTNMLRHWMLAWPRTVQRDDRRLVARHVVANEEGFELVLELGTDLRSCPLLDISNAGLAFSFNPAIVKLHGGDILKATLEVPGMDPWTVHIEIRNIRPSATGTGRCAGARFVGIEPGERFALTGALSAWAHRHRGR